MLVSGGAISFLEVKAEGDVIRRNQSPTRLRQVGNAGIAAEIARVDFRWSRQRAGGRTATASRRSARSRSATTKSSPSFSSTRYYAAHYARGTLTGAERRPPIPGGSGHLIPTQGATQSSESGQRSHRDVRARIEPRRPANRIAERPLMARWGADAAMHMTDARQAITVERVITMEREIDRITANTTGSISSVST